MHGLVCSLDALIAPREWGLEKLLHHIKGLLLHKIAQKLADHRIGIMVGLDLDLLLFYVVFNSQGHITTGSLRVEEPVHISWSRFGTVSHRASASNYQLSNVRRLE